MPCLMKELAFSKESQVTLEFEKQRVRIVYLVNFPTPIRKIVLLSSFEDERNEAQG